MLKKNFLKALSLSAILLSPAAQAVSLDWSGGYRFEWTEIDRPSLGTPTDRKAYGLNYLYLSPKVIAADGVDIVSRFDVLNASNEYANTQIGQIWGANGAGSANATTTNQGVTNLTVSQLYLTVNQEYGALQVGRAPFEFGTGMTYSAGQGMFDHWYSTRDVVGYKIVVGDWFFMPSLTRKHSSGFAQGGTVSSTGLHLQYENAENKSLLAIYQETTKGTQSALSYTNEQIAAYGATAVGSSLDIKKTNFVLGRGFDSFAFKFEAGFETGDTGLINAGGEEISVNSYGLAVDLTVPAQESKWDWGLRMGMASGDDPETTEFSGYSFNRNYDVAMLLFNHRLGQRDFMNTDVVKGSAGLSVKNSADDEAISNAFYLAPSANYAWSDRLSIRNTLVYGQLLQAQKSSVDSSKDLGLEWDIEVTYQPNERIQWVNQIGLLMPGSAWENGAEGLDKDFTFGFASKAAISF